MRKELIIDNQPKAEFIWQGMGCQFQNLGQVINEFLDNSISNFTGNNVTTRDIRIVLEELSKDGDVKVSIEDSGTGIKNLNAAFTLGDQSAGETPLNEHGFGLKHALAFANPNNDSWAVYTRTEEDLDNKMYTKISAPYKMNDFTGEKISEEPWPGYYNNTTGTLIEFVCSRDIFKTLTIGLKGGFSNFATIADVLCEDIGFVYSGIIQKSIAMIYLVIIDADGEEMTTSIGSVTPDFSEPIKPGNGNEKFDLGSGTVDIEYHFGSMNEKPNRELFDNDTTRRYYKKNMSSSGVEIRINGRMLRYNLFKDIWGIEKHNSYNHLLIIVNVKSKHKDRLPTTTTSKNGLRQGDAKLDRLYEWIRSYMSDPVKNDSLIDHETDKFETLCKNLKKYNKTKNKVVDTEKFVFTRTGNRKDRQRVDLYTKIGNEITVYEGKMYNTTSKDVYQLRMYWDGLVYDGVKPDIGILVGKNNPTSVLELIKIVNGMEDANGNNYNLIAQTWDEIENEEE